MVEAPFPVNKNKQDTRLVYRLPSHMLCSASPRLPAIRHQAPTIAPSAKPQVRAPRASIACAGPGVSSAGRVCTSGRPSSSYPVFGRYRLSPTATCESHRTFQRASRFVSHDPLLESRKTKQGETVFHRGEAASPPIALRPKPAHHSTQQMPVAVPRRAFFVFHTPAR